MEPLNDSGQSPYEDLNSNNPQPAKTTYLGSFWGVLGYSNQPSSEVQIRSSDIPHLGKKYYGIDVPTVLGALQKFQLEKLENKKDILLKEAVDLMGKDFEIPQKILLSVSKALEDLEYFNYFEEFVSKAKEIKTKNLERLASKKLPDYALGEEFALLSVSMNMRLAKIFHNDPELYKQNKNFFTEIAMKLSPQNFQRVTDEVMLGYHMHDSSGLDAYMKDSRFFNTVDFLQKNFDKLSAEEQVLVDEGYVFHQPSEIGTLMWLKNRWVPPQNEHEPIWINVIGMAQPGGDSIEFELIYDFNFLKEHLNNDQTVHLLFEYMKSYLGELGSKRTIDSELAKSLISNLGEKNFKKLNQMLEGKLDEIQIKFHTASLSIGNKEVYSPLVTRREKEMKLYENIYHLQKIANIKYTKKEIESLKTILKDSEGAKIFNELILSLKNELEKNSYKLPIDIAHAKKIQKELETYVFVSVSKDIEVLRDVLDKTLYEVSKTYTQQLFSYFKWGGLSSKVKSVRSNEISTLSEKQVVSLKGNFQKPSIVASEGEAKKAIFDLFEFLGADFMFPKETPPVIHKLLNEDKEFLHTFKEALILAKTMREENLENIKKGRHIDREKNLEISSKILEITLRASQINVQSLFNFEDSNHVGVLVSDLVGELILKGTGTNTQDFTDFVLVGVSTPEKASEKSATVERFFKGMEILQSTKNEYPPEEKALIEEGYVIKYDENGGKYLWRKNAWISPKSSEDLEWKNIIGLAQPGGDMIEITLDLDLSFLKNQPITKEEAFEFIQKYTAGTPEKVLNEYKEKLPEDAFLKLKEFILRFDQEVTNRLALAYIAIGDPKVDSKLFNRRANDMKRIESLYHLEELSGYSFKDEEKEVFKDFLKDPKFVLIFDQFIGILQKELQKTGFKTPLSIDAIQKANEELSQRALDLDPEKSDLIVGSLAQIFIEITQ